MGNWSISIEGVGPNNNSLPTDADAIAQNIVDALKNAGQNVTKASFTYGGSKELIIDNG